MSFSFTDAVGQRLSDVWLTMPGWTATFRSTYHTFTTFAVDNPDAYKSMLVKFNAFLGKHSRCVQRLHLIEIDNNVSVRAIERFLHPGAHEVAVYPYCGKTHVYMGEHNHSTPLGKAGYVIRKPTMTLKAEEGGSDMAVLSGCKRWLFFNATPSEQCIMIIVYIART